MFDETIEILGDLIAYPTISADSNRAMIDDIEARLQAHGARTRITTDGAGKANIFATLGPDIDGGIVLSGHTDVVPVAQQPWSSDPFLLTQKGERYYGRGTCDMKGFIAASIAMAGRYSKMNLRRPIHFAFTYDEEAGCLGAPVLLHDLRQSGLRPSIAIIGEPTSMKLVNGHKGCCEYAVKFRGLEGHGSKPAEGVNAVEYAVSYVSKLLSLRDDLVARTPVDSPFDPAETTINVGQLHGGVACNVIAGSAEVEWEMRPVQDSDLDLVRETMHTFVEREILPKMRTISENAMVETVVVGEVPGLDPVDTVAASQLIHQLTGGNDAGLVSFCTEAGLFQKQGISAALCGPGDIAQAHKADEFVSKGQMVKCLDMLDKLGKQLM
ncbi:MAG: acetylornithine deacetylase [Planctomycetota bacterium]|jgi:acetylornithine deacetylase